MKPEQAEKKYISLLRNIDGNKRVKIGAELYETVLHIVKASIKNHNPNISKDELNSKLKERLYK